MTYPKFAVGEDVLICSADIPDKQGVEATIIWRDWKNNSVDIFTNAPSPAGYKYKTDMDSNFDLRQSMYWRESELRKRPSDLSFNELITSLKSKEPV